MKWRGLCFGSEAKTKFTAESYRNRYMDMLQAEMHFPNFIDVMLHLESVQPGGNQFIGLTEQSEMALVEYISLLK